MWLKNFKLHVAKVLQVKWARKLLEFLGYILQVDQGFQLFILQTEQFFFTCDTSLTMTFFFVTLSTTK